MKLKKKSGLMGAIIALSCASLVSVGFASWVITQGDDETITGDIVVDTVSSKEHTITAQWVDGSGVALDNQAQKVVYGHPNSLKQSSDWFYNSNQLTQSALDASTKKENLQFHLKVSVANLETTDTPANIIKTLTLDTDGAGTIEGVSGTGYNAAAAANLVGALPTLTAPASFTMDGTTGSFILDINFLWGSNFGNGNPYNYFNTGAGKDLANREAVAAQRLSDLESALTGASYTITIETN